MPFAVLVSNEKMRLTLALACIAALVLTAAAVTIALEVTPYPSVLLIRRQFEQNAARTSAALEPHVPPGIAANLDVAYGSGPNGSLDVFYPQNVSETARLRTIVWTHGGGWVSGTKAQIDNYARILAARGFAVVSVDYTIAPEARYPVPVRQLNDALRFLSRKASQFHIDSSRFVMAGDSGGAHIAAQLANALTSPAYARDIGVTPAIRHDQLLGTLLYCGGYDLTKIDLNGQYGGFLRTVLWAYTGTKNFESDPAFATASVVNYLTPRYPPSFVSVGNADPLEAQSRELADALKRLRVKTETLFFAKDYTPALPHEYQFDLDTSAGRTALDRSVAFLKSLP
jgi:acetyl esterase/lipase